MASTGHIQIFDQKSTAMSARLYNFDVGQSQLKREHKEWLRYNVVWYLKRGGSILLVGMASRTGTDASNLALSQRRIQSVVNFLRRESPNNFKVALTLEMGERVAELRGERDGKENAAWRGVALSVWLRPTPPPPVPIPEPRPAPPPVKQRIYAHFLWEYSDRGGDGGDPSSARRLAQKSAEYAYDAYNSHDLMAEKEMPIPAHHVVRQILVDPDTTGSMELGVAAVKVLTVHVRYEWGRRLNPFCVLVNSMRLRGAFQNEAPDIVLLTDEQTDRWLKNPFRALKDLKDWPLRKGDYGTYKSGGYKV